MGAGRKTTTLHLKEKGTTSWTTNISAPARNLGNDLGGVIFGCKNSTIKECHSKMLFGLPAPHIAYVRNIRPSLTLFLFNYSTRNLHGIYEAISPGKMDINKHAWSSDSADLTPYRAQVRIKVRTQCSPLSEDEFKPLISGNYYEPKLFWFELDQTQTTGLITMFTSRTSISRPLHMDVRTTAFSTLKRGHSINDAGARIPRKVLAPLDNVELGFGGSCAALSCGETKNNGIHSKSGRSYAAIVSGSDTSLPKKKSIPSSERKWTSLFKSSTSTGTKITKGEGVFSSDILSQSGEMNILKADNSDRASVKYDVEKEHIAADNSGCGSGTYSAELQVEAPTGAADNSGWGSGTYSAEWQVEALTGAADNSGWGSGTYSAELQVEAPTGAADNSGWGCETYSAEWQVEAPTGAADNSGWGSGTYSAEWQVEAPTGAADNSGWGSESYSAEWQVGAPTGAADNSGWGSGTYSAEWQVEAPTGAEKGKYNNSLPWFDDDASVTIPDCPVSYEGLTGSGKGPESNFLCSDEGWSNTSQVIPQQDGDGQAKSFADKTYDETLPREVNAECSYAPRSVEMDCTDNHDEESVFVSEMAAQVQVNECSSEIVATEEMDSPELQALVIKLMEEVEAMKVSQQRLQRKLVESNAEVKWLRTHYQKLESGLLPSTKDVEKAIIDSSNEPYPVIHKSILIIGGFNGSSWLPDISSYLPCEDSLTYLAPMSIVRKYSSAVAMNGDVYVLGGADGDTWQNTVESYNSFTEEWSSRPTLNQKKGSLAGASLYDKIFAIGGGDGKECFSNVEMLDLNIGKWLPTRSMLHKRFTPAAAELNGAIYVVGGYDGESYLSSAERFDPREPSWTTLRNMSTKRGCHSLTVLNDKLFALGGFDGANMVSSVEIFDPRVGSWTMGEPMNSPRGYCGAAVLGEKIHIIGGTTTNYDILDTIELYEEGGGWEVSGLKAVGKRCFISTMVI